MLSFVSPTHSPYLFSAARRQRSVDDGLSGDGHGLHHHVTHFFLQRPGESLVGIGLDAKVALDGFELPKALLPIRVELVRDLLHLADLHLEALVLSLLTLVGFDGHVLEDANLFLQVALNVVTLCVCDRLDSVLLALQLTDLLAGEGNLLLQLDDLLLELVNGSLKAEWLLRAERCI